MKSAIEYLGIFLLNGKGRERMNQNKNFFWNKPVVVCIFAILCCCLWGSAFPSIKLGYQWWEIASDDTASQILFAGCRFSLAGVITILLGSILQKKLLVPNGKAIKQIFVLALFQTALQYFFFYIGLANTTGVKASIITSANVFLAIIMASIIFHQEKLQIQTVIGCILGFMGVILVNMQAGFININVNILGDGAIFVSALSAAISSVFIKKFSQESNPVMLSGYQFFLGGIILITGGIGFGGSIHTESFNGIWILLYLAMLSAVAYTIWGILLKYNPVSKVTIYGFANPIAGVLLSMLILQEKQEAGLIIVLALLLVSVGIYLVNRVSKK